MVFCQSDCIVLWFFLKCFIELSANNRDKKKKRMCSSCIWIFVLSLLCGWGQMNQGIYWGHQAFCAWVSAVVHQFHSYWQRAAITAHINKVTCQIVWTLAILSNLTNDQRCCFLARTVFALKGTCTVPSLLFFFILFFSLSVFIHCLWRKKRSFNSADVGRYHCWDPQPQSVLDYLVQATKYCVGFKHKFIW